MPQGRKKTPFSGKAKKLQLKAKRQRKAGAPFVKKGGLRNDDEEEDETEKDVLKVNQQPSQGGRRNANRYALQFYRESDAEVRRLKQTAMHSLQPVPEESLEIDIDQYFPPELDFPKRPPWNFDMSREEFEAREQRYFREYVQKILEQNIKDLSYFELNLETWRQLWRVIEMSDIILIIVDIRYSALMFPPSLYKYVTEELKKDMILVLNKIDLAPAPLVVAWKHYFKEKFPELHVLMFTSYPSYNLRGNQDNKAGLKIRRRKGRLRMSAEGAQKLFEACQAIVEDKVDLSSWHNKIMEEMNVEYEDEEIEIEETIHMKKVDTSFVEHEKFLGGVLTIGCVGQPNVGKSSLMNAIMGKKVVSVSKTPGHTKHFQTIFLTSNVRLCDCPGLVFPSRVPKPLQILMGSFPIAQVREPFSTVRFLAERLDLPHLLALQHIEREDEWTSMDICESWALKRGFRTARAARLDAYRAANHILRMALEGKICLCFYPPFYTVKKEQWEHHEEVELVRWIQAATTGAGNEEQFHQAQYDSESSEDDVPQPSQERRGKENEENSENSQTDDEDEEEDYEEDDDDDDDDDDLVPKSVGMASNKFSILNTDD
ncbi:guanine nucleotide-binding protein-like 1 [Anabrus simplex]|uniref:guanine nucleotide-binding protein-like 1 n=1 Tax=Anabrus simplex TaxID=316456 RepID=UPI0035A2823A